MTKMMKEVLGDKVRECVLHLCGQSLCAHGGYYCCRCWGVGLSVGLLVEVSAFLESFHWPIGAGDLGFGVFLTLSSSCSKSGGRVRGWYWKRLFLLSGVLDAQFQCRRFRLDQAWIFGVPAGFGVVSCGFLDRLPGGLGRFVPCGTGANHCRLWHVGWEKVWARAHFSC